MTVENTSNFTAFLEKQNSRYESKKLKVSLEQIRKLLNDASNEFYLLIKVALIFALNEANAKEKVTITNA